MRSSPSAAPSSGRPGPAPRPPRSALSDLPAGRSVAVAPSRDDADAPRTFRTSGDRTVGRDHRHRQEIIELTPLLRAVRFGLLPALLQKEPFETVVAGASTVETLLDRLGPSGMSPQDFVDSGPGGRCLLRGPWIDDDQID